MFTTVTESLQTQSKIKAPMNTRVDNKNTVKHVLSGHSKIDKTKALKTNGSLMKVESIAECFLGAFCNILDLH